MISRHTLGTTDNAHTADARKHTRSVGTRSAGIRSVQTTTHGFGFVHALHSSAERVDDAPGAVAIDDEEGEHAIGGHREVLGEVLWWEMKGEDET